MSRRLGRDKPLLLLNERPFVAHCLDALVRAGVNDPVVVAGRHNFISRYPGSVDLFKTPDEGTVLDIDTWEDYRLLQDRFAGRIPEGTTGPVPPAGSPEANR